MLNCGFNRLFYCIEINTIKHIKRFLFMYCYFIKIIYKYSDIVYCSFSVIYVNILTVVYLIEFLLF